MNSFFDYIIDVGRKGSLPPKNELAENGLTIRFPLQGDWKSLNNEDLIYLFRGLVILEEYWFISGEHIGSTTDTKFVYREILNRQLDNDYSLGNWAFVYSSNPYVPLDTGNRHGAQTIYEYLHWQSELEERRVNEGSVANNRKEEKKRLKAEAHAERLRKKEIRDKELGYK